MKVFAIDPGPEKSAYVIWNGAAILEAEWMDNETLRGRLTNHVRGARPRVVCEKIASYGMAVGASVFQTCFETGRFWQICAPCEGIVEEELIFHLMERGKVKMHLCHSMKAKDSNIRQALIDRFGPPGTKKQPGLTFGLSGDKWAAFALAVTFFDQALKP